MSVILNKQLIQDATACIRLAFFRVRDRERGIEQPLSASDQLRLMYGDQVGQKAREEFPNGILVHANSFTTALAETDRLIRLGTKTLFEPAFTYDGIRIRADVLIRDGDEFNLYEVKSGLSPDEYIEDVAVQVHVLEGLGMPVRPNLMLLDKQATTESASRFRIIECEAEVRAILPELRERIGSIKQKLGTGEMPEGPITRACRDCDYLNRCLPDLPEHSVFSLFRGGKKIDKLIGQGIMDLNELPSEINLTSTQSTQIATIKNGQPWISKNLSTALVEDIVYPLYYLDFEAACEPLPRFANQHPYEVTPFQWSCHVVDELGKEPRHHEFLITESGDPRQPFSESLLDCLGETGSIIVYTSYEKTAIKAMAKALPDLSPRLLALVPRLHDLHRVVSQHYYHPDFMGSYSIKRILPILVPDLSYDDMEIGDGMAAVWAYHQLVHGDMPSVDKVRVREALLRYCSVDTLAMLRVHEALGRIAGSVHS